MEYESIGTDGVKQQFDAIEEVYVDLNQSTELTNNEKEAIMSFKNKVKPTLH